MKTVAVYAGNHAQFRDFVNWNIGRVNVEQRVMADVMSISVDDTRFVYVTPESIRGIGFDEFVNVGTWYERPDRAAVELVVALQMRKR